MISKFRKLSCIAIGIVIIGTLLAVNTIPESRITNQNSKTGTMLKDGKFSISTQSSKDNLKIETIKTIELNIEDLTEGNNVLYIDENAIVSADVNFHLNKNARYKPQSSDPDFGYSTGFLPEIATLNPSHKTYSTFIQYIVEWNEKITSVHSLEYSLLLGTVTMARAYVVKETPTMKKPAMAVGEIQYCMTNCGCLMGSYNKWLKTEINSMGQVKISWNY